jgi:hypothetical protein
MHRRNEKCIQIIVENPNVRLGVVGIIILKCILGKKV